MLRTAVSSAVRRSAAPATPCFWARAGSTAGSASQRFYSSGSTIHGNDPDLLEQEKQRNMKKEQHHTSTPHEHAPGWNEYLASTSEAYTKADKSTVSIHELQDKTVQYLTKRHPATVTEKVAETVSNAVDGIKEAAGEVKDKIKGPLASALGRKSSPDVDTAQDTTSEKKYQKTSSEEAVKANRNNI